MLVRTGIVDIPCWGSRWPPARATGWRRDARMSMANTSGGVGSGQYETTGLRTLDEVLGGGLPTGALALIVGPPGSGKTTVAAQLAFAAARIDRKVLLLTALSEPTEKLITH